MTAKTAGQKPTPIPGPRSAHAYEALVLSGEVIYNGALVQKDPATGKWVEATSTGTGIVHGWARLGDVDSFDGTAAAALSPVPEMLVDSGCNLVVFGSITQADEGKIAYITDDQTMTLTPGGPIGGMVQLFSDSTHAYVSVDPLVNKALSLTSAGAGPTMFKCRGVATSIGANTGTGTGTLTVTATGALGAQDGLTYIANQFLFIQEGTTNVADIDAGPWQVSVAGTTGVSAVLVRPSWWAHGAPIVQGAIIEMGGEGTAYAGTTWKSFAAVGKTVDTHAPVFWPREMSVTPAAFSSGVSPTISTIPIRAATKVGHSLANTGTAAHASTRVWRPTTITPGVLGTAALVWTAESAPGTANASDVGVYTATVINW